MWIIESLSKMLRARSASCFRSDSARVFIDLIAERIVSISLFIWLKTKMNERIYLRSDGMVFDSIYEGANPAASSISDKYVSREGAAQAIHRCVGRTRSGRLQKKAGGYGWKVVEVGYNCLRIPFSAWQGQYTYF